MKASVSQLVIDELGIRAECIEEECPTDAGFLRTGIAKIKAGDKPTENELQVIKDEMEVLETFDVFVDQWQDWYCAMAWLGLLDKYNVLTASYLGRKPKKVMIDGVAYERWN